MKFNLLIHWSPSSIFESPLKTGIRFSSNKFLHKCLFKISLWRVDEATSFFLISSKIWSKSAISIPIHSGTTYFWLSLFAGAKYQGGDEAEARALISNHCLINHCWYDLEKLTVPGSSNLKKQYKVLCSGNERKICYIFLNNLGLIILGNQVYLAVSKGCLLSFHWFNDSWTRWFELVTRGFELETRGLELVTCEFKLATRGFEFALLNLNSCF